MSIFSTIIVDIERFFKAAESDAAKYCKAFWSLFKKAPNALQVVQNFINEAAPVITAAVSIADPLVEPAVASALAVTEGALAATEASLDAAVSGQSLLANIKAFGSTIPALLTGLEIKDAALKAAVERIVAFLTGEAEVLIPAVEAWVKQINNKNIPDQS